MTSDELRESAKNRVFDSASIQSLYPPPKKILVRSSVFDILERYRGDFGRFLNLCRSLPRLQGFLFALKEKTDLCAQDDGIVGAQQDKAVSVERVDDPFRLGWQHAHAAMAERDCHVGRKVYEFECGVAVVSMNQATGDEAGQEKE